MKTCNIKRIFNGAAGNKSILTMAWSPICEYRIFIGTNANSLYQLDINNSDEREIVEFTNEIDLNSHKPLSGN